MFRTPSGDLLFSPSDLIAWLEGDFASWCDRLRAERLSSAAGVEDHPEIHPDEADEEKDLLSRKGTEHEQRFLTELRARFSDIVELEQGNRDPAPTLKAMRAGAPVIYQPFLSLPPFAGYPDFLFRVLGASHFGDFQYQPWDTKLARSAKPYFLVQLSAYAEMLQEIQGVRPEEMVFVLGNGEERRFRTDDYFYYYLELKRSFLDFQARWDRNAMPHPGLDRSWGKWTECAEAILESSDHLSRVANITRSQIKRLEAAGVPTMAALAQAAALRVPRITEPVLDRLRVQARLQVESADLDRPAFLPRPEDPAEPRRGLALLPPPSALDVFFDLEGFPFAEGGLEYLFGVTAVEAEGPAFHDWWAHDHAGEKLAFEHFLDWATERRQRDPAMHIYHYAGYEKTAICRLMGRYATRETQVDDLLRNGVLVDLYTVVRQGLIVGTPSYSLKDIERVFGQERSGDVTTAAGSVVEYQRWLDSGEPGEWSSSPILSGIRDYNRVDCESTWRLRDWLLAQQTALGIPYIPPPTRDAKEEPEEPDAAHPAGLLAERLKNLVARGGITDPERARVTELLAHLLEFHRREEKPMWWRMFERNTCTEEQLFDDPDCLAGLRRSERPPFTIKRSVGLEYRFDPDQDSKLREGGKVMASHDLEWKAEIAEFDGEAGRLVLKTTKPEGARDLLHLIPYEHVSAEPIEEAIQRFVEAWADGPPPSPALDDFLFRRLPRVKGHAGGPLLVEGDLVPQAIDIARRLAGTTLCIQGPPGTGKTYTAAAIIAALLRDGKRIGVTSNSHKAIINLMNAVVDALGAEAGKFPLIKVGSEADAEGARAPIRAMESKAAAQACGNAPGVAGGTAWFFSRPELSGCFDYLFVDEAGQVSLANLVAMGSSARNLILVGDQMQLAQPSQGSHPGESGLSCLDYLLAGHATIPPELGIFLGLSRRMHPGVCLFISEAVYQGRLSSLPATATQRIVAAGSSQLIPRESGVVFVPVEHEGNAQCSDEEVEQIQKIVAELTTRTVIDQAGRSHPLTLARDILLVSPFNMQVRRLKDALGPGCQVGSVDKFQGQEAPVVIVSLASSSLEDSPRGAAFLLNRNRLNVAVSRAQALAIVVASPALLAPRCRTIEEMGLVNLLGKLRHHSRAGGA